MAFSHIMFEKKNKVATITLNEPVSNWLTILMMREINEALMDVKKDPTIQLLVFDHAGEKAFCDGVDVADHTEDKVLDMIEVFHRMFRLMEELDCTTVALVNGRSLAARLRAYELLRYRYCLREGQDRSARDRSGRIPSDRGGMVPEDHRPQEHL
jgi:enoyl-CoA hydratase/carnithine racemase